MPKRYNTPHRDHIIKTRMTEEEHADFMERLTAYGMSQSEFIRQAITGVTVKPIINMSCINDDRLTAVGRLTGEYAFRFSIAINAPISSFFGSGWIRR